ncbi:acyl-CoA N-acyltransferase [Rhizophagus irregularis]|uniref:N-terminal methionine N(alpha)-acetyltransferase NatC n=3 Tax=Rhizophagus irregularis TaxID=588596 RepID=A0A2I1F0B3_9GLOM|nr:Mak3p [Rhizophagus irregularis DAOM 197198w]PKC04581.1 acyl-CoA N-acyltransferase [Rhizophagus irregularis]GET52097.1 N-alpha-acetyltransferase 30 [Rhizophagus irregularis DAOM 181602=DAOM 197198]PKC66914.1 acyl-CoA N-acyltransferase [Rhizophagus irregularis]PKK69397.1 acyl-CoA N-acyltransferase [Rhizophagus irregularis]
MDKVKNKQKTTASTSSIIKQLTKDSPDITYVPYSSELQLPGIMSLIENDLSEPYSIYTYRYFINNWPNLCFMAMDQDKCIGVIICKLDRHRDALRGYIAMLAVKKEYRKRKIGTTLVKIVINAMKLKNADEIVLETEYTNLGALSLYHNLGFIRDKRLYRYYLNGVDAFRLKLFCKSEIQIPIVEVSNRAIVEKTKK